MLDLYKVTVFEAPRTRDSTLTQLPPDAQLELHHGVCHYCKEAVIMGAERYEEGVRSAADAGHELVILCEVCGIREAAEQFEHGLLVTGAPAARTRLDKKIKEFRASRN